MDDIMVMDGLVAVDDLFEDRKGLLFIEAFFLLDCFGQILIAKLCDDIDVGFSVVDIINSDDVLFVLELLKESNLVLEKFFVQFAFNELEIDKFDGDLLI